MNSLNSATSLSDFSSRSEQFETLWQGDCFHHNFNTSATSLPCPPAQKVNSARLATSYLRLSQSYGCCQYFCQSYECCQYKKKRTQMLTCKSNEPLVFQATSVWLAVWGPRAERMHLSCTVPQRCHTCSHGGSSERGPNNTPPVHNTLYSHGLRTALNERHPNTQQNKSTCWTHWSSKINSYKALKRKKAWQTLVWPWNDVSVTTSWCGHTGLETDLS